MDAESDDADDNSCLLVSIVNKSSQRKKKRSFTRKYVAAYLKFGFVSAGEENSPEPLFTCILYVLHARTSFLVIGGPRNLTKDDSRSLASKSLRTTALDKMETVPQY